MKKKFLSVIIFIFLITANVVNAAWYDSEFESSMQKGFISQKLYENPESYISRGEVCDLLVSYYEYMSPQKNIENKTNKFTDIEKSEYKYSIEKAYSLGIINGVTEFSFVPDENITREQFVTLIYRMNGSPMAETFYYEDNNEISEYAFPAIDYSVKNKIVMGTSKGYFSPKDNITKAQAIVIVNRLIENQDLLNYKKNYSGVMLRTESDDYICYITRRFEPMGFWIAANRGIPSPDRPLDQLVIIDKKTNERKIIELQKIVSLFFFDAGDKLYIPVCRITSSTFTDSYNEGMYIVDKITGNYELIETPVLIEPFAVKDDSIYYFMNVKTEQNTLRTMISRYNFKTKEVTMSKQPCIGDFEADNLLYLDENEAILNYFKEDRGATFSVDLNTLELKLISKKPVFGINKNYYIALNDDVGFKADLYDRKTNNIIRTLDLCDEFGIVSENVNEYTEAGSIYKRDAVWLNNFETFDINGELYLKYEKNILAQCVTDTNMFEIDYFYKFLNEYVEVNDIIRKDKAFFFHNIPYKRLSFDSYGMEYPATDAMIATLNSRKIYGSYDIEYTINAYKAVRNFCEEYRRKYQEPYQLIKALNNYLTYECDYDYDTYNGLPVERTYSAYTAAGVVVDKTGVCGGFALTVEEVLRFCNIKCLYVTGDTYNGEHAWNIIEIDGKKYYMDSTWNSCYKDENAYYMMTYDEISFDHKLDERYKLYAN